MGSIVCTAPTSVIQEGMTCWAAALVSWLSVKKESPIAWRIKTKEGILEEIRGWSKLSVGAGESPLIHDNGGLTKEGTIWVLEQTGMRGQAFPVARSLTSQFVMTKLSAFGQLFALRVLDKNGLSHAVVIYGIDGVGPTATLNVMDPNFGLTTRTIGDYQKDRQIFIGWLPS